MVNIFRCYSAGRDYPGEDRIEVASLPFAPTREAMAASDVERAYVDQLRARFRVDRSELLGFIEQTGTFTLIHASHICRAALGDTLGKLGAIYLGERRAHQDWGERRAHQDWRYRRPVDNAGRLPF